MPCLLGTDLCGGGARRRSREGGEGGARHGAVLPTRLQIRTGANPWDHHSCWSPEPRLGEKDDRSKSVCQLNNAKTDLRKIDAGEEWIETSPGENVETTAHAEGVERQEGWSLWRQQLVGGLGALEEKPAILWRR